MRKWARISVPTFVCDRDEGAINNVSHKERRGKKRQGQECCESERKRLQSLGMFCLP